MAQHVCANPGGAAVCSLRLPEPWHHDRSRVRRDRTVMPGVFAGAGVTHRFAEHTLQSNGTLTPKGGDVLSLSVDPKNVAGLCWGIPRATTAVCNSTFENTPN